MRGFKGSSRLVVVAMSAATLLLLAAVGASAGAGTFGSEKAIASVVALVSGQSNLTAATTDTTTNAPSTMGEDNGEHLDKEKGLCHPPKKHHKHGTPGHKHHPCGDEDDDSD